MVALSPIALLLEDDGLIAMDVEDALKDMGFAPVVLASCSDALAWLASNPLQQSPSSISS